MERQVASQFWHRLCSQFGMKLMLLLVLAAATVAQAQTDKALRGAAIKPADVRSHAAQPIKDSGTNYLRIVDGKAYDVRSSSNWVTLPGPGERARYLRLSNHGPVFALEKRMEVRYRQGASDGTRVWYEPYQEIAIKNYPEQGLVVDAFLPAIRVLLIRTTSEGIAVYNFGTLPKAAPAKKP